MEVEAEDSILPLASRWQRLGAFIIDLLIVGLPLFYIHIQRPALAKVLDHYIANPQDATAQKAYIEAFQPVSLTILLSYLVYCFFLEGSDLQATFGKKVFSLRVVRSDGTGLSVWESLFRSSSKIASYMALNIGFLWIIFDRKRQGWHDKLADTVVVKDQ